MITTVIRGGLGNQLFQYASSYALSRRLKQPLSLDISFFPKQTLRGYKLNKLKIPEDTIVVESLPLQMRLLKNRGVNHLIREYTTIKELRIGRKTVYLAEHTGSFEPHFFDIYGENIFMNGYYQSEEYFSAYRDEILQTFLPAYSPDAQYTNVLNRIKNCNSVAVHVRHGDFTQLSKSNFHYILGTDYYVKAIDEMLRRIESPTFFCFSDDIEWVKANIGGTKDFQFIQLSTPNADIDELMLMKNCNHIITANSTFSWWAAWLNEHEDAIRIVPDKAYGNDHMIPDGWIKIPVE